LALAQACFSRLDVTAAKFIWVCFKWVDGELLKPSRTRGDESPRYKAAPDKSGYKLASASAAV